MQKSKSLPEIDLNAKEQKIQILDRKRNLPFNTTSIVIFWNGDPCYLSTRTKMLFQGSSNLQDSNSMQIYEHWKEYNFDDIKTAKLNSLDKITWSSPSDASKPLTNTVWA